MQSQANVYRPLLMAGVLGSIVTAGMVLSKDKPTRKRVMSSVLKMWGWVAANGVITRTLESLKQEMIEAKKEIDDRMQNAGDQEMELRTPGRRSKAMATP